MKKAFLIILLATAVLVITACTAVDMEDDQKQDNAQGYATISDSQAATIDDSLPSENASDPTADSVEPVTVPLTTDPTNPLNVSEDVDDWDDAPDDSTGSTDSTGATESTGTAPTSPTEGDPSVDESGDHWLVTYEQYLAMTDAERRQQQYRFGAYPRDDVNEATLDKYFVDFFTWHDAALAEYEKNNPGASGGGSIDIGDYMNGTQNGN